MRPRFFADNGPIDLSRVPPVDGSVLAKRLVRRRPPPPFPALKAALCGIPAATAYGAIQGGFLSSWDPFHQTCFIGAAALPFASVLGRHSWKYFFGREIRWPILASEFPNWMALTEALKDSTHAVGFRGEVVRERDHLFLGLTERGRYPLLLNKVYLNRPAIILGRTGAGKTKLVAETLITQAISRRNRHIVVLDLKVDKSFMLGLAKEAARRRVDFKWLTLEPSKSSYLWNPLSDRGVRLLVQEQIIQIVLKALSLVTTQAHGAGYFGAMQEERTRRTFERNVLRSFREFYRTVRDQRATDVGMNDRDFSNAGHLIANLARIASVGVLNAVDGDTVPEPALRGSISLVDVLSRPGVTYFALPAQLEPTTAMFVAKLVIHLLAAVAKVYQGPRVPVLVWVDEFQEVLSGGGSDLATPIRQSRESEVTYWLGTQDLAALQTPDGDFTNAVLGNTPLKIFCTAEDEVGRAYIKQTSGETLRPLQSVTTTTTQSAEGTSTSMGAQFREEAVARIDDETINRVNRDPNAFIVSASESKGFSQYRFPVVVRSTFSVTAEEFARRQATPWPKGNRFTVSIDPNPSGGSQVPPPPIAPAPSVTAQAQIPPDPQSLETTPREAVPERAAAAGPRRRGRPPKRVQADATPDSPSIAERTGTSEMADYLRRLAGEAPGSEEKAR